MPIQFYSPSPMLGSGFPEESLRQMVARQPDFIACDAGTMDGGPMYLGSNAPLFSRRACKRDLSVLLPAARSAGIPLLIGSCGGSGSNWGVDWTFDIVAEVAREQGLRAKVALVYCEPSREVLLDKFRQGRIRPLEPDIGLDEAALMRMVRVVAMIGPQAYTTALAQGADIVLAGRSSDAALFAAVPVERGFPAGLAWHAGKIMECGAAATVRMHEYDGMYCTMDEDSFTLEPANAGQHVTPLSVASHSLYETGDPYRLVEPGGVLLTASSRFEAVDDRRVRVSGSRFEPQPYTLRLEGAEQLGFQSVAWCAVRDPVILERLDEWLEEADRKIAQRVSVLFDASSLDGHLHQIRIYGRNGVMGEREPRPYRIGSEVALMVNIVASSQLVAHDICAAAVETLLHLPIDTWKGPITGIALPFTGHVVDRGPAYTFALNHVVELDDPLELVSIIHRELT